MPICPVCASPSTAPDRLHGYQLCTGCGLGFQDPLPPKVFEGGHEPFGATMGEGERAVNRGLATNLFARVMRGQPGRCLDVGAKYPFLAHCLRSLGNDAIAMDGIDASPEFGQELGVPMLHLDFEAYDFAGHEPFDLITLVHCFEHLYDPLVAILKLRRLVSPTGRVFLRIPDHGVAGYEPNLAPSHLVIHPYFHTLTSLLELLVKAVDAFVVESTYTISPGQRDIVLRPIGRSPWLGVGVIAKNEQTDLPRMIRSLEGVADRIHLVDTGSTDDTVDAALAASHACTLSFSWEKFTEASVQNEAGEWQIIDFSKAKNRYLERLERFGGMDLLMWMDADDELLTPSALHRRKYHHGSVLDVAMTKTADGRDRWEHCRIWPASFGVRFARKVHETPTVDGHPRELAGDVLIRHHEGVRTGQEGGFARNYRIMKADWDAGEKTARNAFYLGQSCQGLGPERRQEASDFHKARVSMGPAGHPAEWLLSHVELAKLERELGRPENAREVLLGALGRGGHILAEVWMQLALIDEHVAPLRAIGFALQAHEKPTPSPWAMWFEQNMYEDQPPRLISWCYEHLGRIEDAIEWAIIARAKIGRPDGDWELRIERLRRLLAKPMTLEQEKGFGEPPKPGHLSYSQHGQDRWIWEHLLGGYPMHPNAGLVVDVGASDGVEWSNSKMLEERGYHAICVEPNPSLFAKLEKNRPKATLHRAAVDAHANAAKDFLYLANDRVRTELMGGLVDRYTAEHRVTVDREVAEYSGVSQVLKVKCLDLNSVISLFVDRRPAVLCLDVEGAEIPILQAWSSKHYPMDVVLVEANTQALADETIAVMGEKGYVYMTTLGHDLVFRHVDFVPKPAKPPASKAEGQIVTGLTPPPIEPEDEADVLERARHERTQKLARREKPRIGLLRPGAVGDVIMTLNLVPLLKQRFPGHEVHYVTRSSQGLERLMAGAGVDRIVTGDSFEGRDYDLQFNLVGYPLAEGYPDKPIRKHLIEHFADDMVLGLGADPFGGVRFPELPFLVSPMPGSPKVEWRRYATLQVKTGWSKYKEWPLDRWANVVARLKGDVEFVQIGAADEPRVPGAYHGLMGQGLAASIAVVAHAGLHVGLDSFANHLTHVRWRSPGGELRHVPGVILWGSTQVSASGYPTNENLSVNLPCQPCFREDPAISRMPRGPCDQPPGQTYDDPKHDCMAGIHESMVVNAIRRMWAGEGPRRRLAALPKDQEAEHA